MGPIEKGIPIPNHDGRGIYPRTSKWGERYAEMVPGDSFTVDPREYMAARLAAALRQIPIVTRLDPNICWHCGQRRDDHRADSQHSLACPTGEKTFKAVKHIHRIWRL